MKKQGKKKIRIWIGLIAIAFIIFTFCGVHYYMNYIQKQLLDSNEEEVVNLATVIGKSFKISDEEVSYMKALSFNEMENDPINLRLMEIVDGTSVDNFIRNIYVLVPLSDEESKYIEEQDEADFFGCEIGTKLNGMWLLNGKFDENGHFQSAKREDIYRYIEFCSSDLKVFEQRKSFGFVSNGPWGEFITGYAPFYSSDGTFVGIIGVDMDINHYYERVSGLTKTFVLVISVIACVLAILLLIFFIKYVHMKEGMVYYDFYSRISHDLRTPMNGILGIAELSEDENDPSVLKENIGKMKESGKYLLGLINDTLDVEKIQSGKLTIVPDIIETCVIVNDIENMVAATAKEKGVNFEVKVIANETDDYILGDSIRLKQIFVNLLSNAIKFTPAGGTVEWLIDVPAREGDIAHNVFTIRDTGIGMSDKFLKNEIFKPFSQEHNTSTTQYAGSGLGLSIVKNLVELMGGTIHVTSEIGEGTTFVIKLDFEKVQNKKAEELQKKDRKPEQMSSHMLEGKKILLVEDHPLNAEIAQKLLEKYGCIVTRMENGQLAVEHFEQSALGFYDAILMDIRMPVMDGLEATRKIRSLQRTDAKNIPIIAMTANAYEEDVKMSHESGMNAHLAKPIDPKTIYQVLGSYLR